MTDPKQALVRIDPQMLLTKAVEGNANIETLERLVALAKDVREVQAKEAWHEAMAEFQRTVPPIRKTSTAKVVTMRGQYTYNYAELGDILEIIRPIMGNLGLTVTWDTDMQADRVVVSCKVSHVLGHTENSGKVSMPVPQDEGRGGGNPSHRVGSALTYARRYSLLCVTGLCPEDDDDARGTEKRKEATKETPQAALEPPPLKDLTPPEEPSLSVDGWKQNFIDCTTKKELQDEWTRFYGMKDKYNQEEYVAILMAKDSRKSELSEAK